MERKTYNISNHKNEFYPTPVAVRDDLYGMVRKNPKIRTILDPCAGTKNLEVEGYDYTLYDIERRVEDVIELDFLTKAYDGERYDAVVMNPPFNRINDFIKKSFEYTDDIYCIGTWTAIKSWVGLVEDINYKRYFGDFRNVKSRCICFHLNKRNPCPKSYEYWRNRLTLPRTAELHTIMKPYDVSEADGAKWCIRNRLSPSLEQWRAVDKCRGYLPMHFTEDLFYYTTNNAYVRKGEPIQDLQFYVFKNKEEADRYAKVYTDNWEYCRNYFYDSLHTVKPARIPLLDWGR